MYLTAARLTATYTLDRPNHDRCNSYYTYTLDHPTYDRCNVPGILDFRTDES